jgi:pimeloyl-ACP methyl ester carboxylesterase
MRQPFKPPARRVTALALLVMVAAALSACGSSTTASSPTVELPRLEPLIAVSEGPGSLVRAERLGTVTASTIAQHLPQSRLALTNAQPRYDVQTWRLRYRTLNEQGVVVEASGLAAVPIKPAGQASPVLSYQHGTVFKDAEAPTNLATEDEPAVAMASLGYFAVAADYLGYGTSKGMPHPYLRAAPTASAVVDMLTAARVWRQQTGFRANGQLFLMGYSEGGYATMAAHRSLQTGTNVHREQLVEVYPGGGPYHVTVTMNGIMDLVRDRSLLVGSLLQPGLLRYLGSSLREEVREELVKALIPRDADVVFDTTFIDQFLADNEAALERDSNVHDWVPTVPVRLFHGQAERTVPYASASATLQAMKARGATNVSLTDCTADNPDHLPCLPHWFNFVLTRLALSARDL